MVGQEDSGVENKYRFNLEFMRFYSPLAFVIDFLCSLAVSSAWIFTSLFQRINDLNISTLFIVFFLGAFAWFAFATFLCRSAGNTPHESARIAARRSLFTFAVMLIVPFCLLMIAGRVSWDQRFYFLLKYMLFAMIAEGILVIPLGFGITWLRGRRLYPESRFRSG